MRVVDLDRDMSDVIPTGVSIDSEFLFERMENATLDALGCGENGLVLDVASGIGQDDRTLARRGVRAVGAEPSSRMMALAHLEDAELPVDAAVRLCRVRAWSEALPFASETFDSVFCKGSLDHFDDPSASIREMARVTRPGGRVVLAVANFESLGCRLSRRWPPRARPGRRTGRLHFDVPSDHFTRYDARLLREELGAWVEVDRCFGVSLLWGVRSWASLLRRLGSLSGALLRAADWIARRLPSLADVIIISGRPLPVIGGASPPAGTAALRAASGASVETGQPIEAGQSRRGS